jgi:hypothetical protein
MGAAAIISLGEGREKKPRAEDRRELHERFDHWLDTLAAQRKTLNPTLEELTRAVWEQRHALTGHRTAALVAQRHRAAHEQRSAPGPQCGRTVAAQAVVSRTVDTLVGEVEVDRPYFYCVPCGQGFFPLDATLGLAAGRKHFDLQRAAATLTAEVPDGTARELFRELTGVPLGTERLHTVTNTVATGLGILDVAPTRREIEEQIAAVAAGRRQRPIWVSAIDGAQGPTRLETAQGSRPGRKKQQAKRAHWQGQWRQAKGFRCSLVDDDRIIHLLRWYQIQSDEELFAALRQVRDAGLIPEEQGRLCVVADGAPWIWQGVAPRFPMAQEILDSYHGSPPIPAVAELHSGANTAPALEWIEATMARLFAGEADRGIGGLRRLPPATDTAAAAISKLISSLREPQQRLNYGARRRAGYPVGRGGIASANKFIGHARLKRSGAWWYVANSTHRLALRCAKYKGTFERIFDRYKQSVLAKSQQRNVKK